MRAALLLPAALALSGCGYVGEPLPPALNIARTITDLRAMEYGDRILIEFTIPELTTEDLPLTKIASVDLRIGPGPAPFDTGRWAASAKPVAVPAAGPGPARTFEPAREWVGKEVVIGVRVVNSKGRASEWSNLVVVNVIPPLTRPASVAVEPHAEGVKVTWASAAPRARVFRKLEGNANAPDLLDGSAAPGYVDKTAEIGKRYEYIVQAVQDGAESELSEPAVITVRDVFPPGRPAGLSAVPGIGTVELVWERNTEPDLRGYRIYRAAADGELERLGDIIDAPAFSDRQVEAGKRYRYTVTAVDTAGNESGRSAVVEVTAP
jgi:hypothetical protein